MRFVNGNAQPQPFDDDIAILTLWTAANYVCN